MVYGVNARQHLKQVRTIQIIIVFKLRIQMRWFMELMLGNVGNKLEPFIVIIIVVLNRQHSKNLDIQIIIVFMAQIDNGVNASNVAKQVRTIQIIIVF